MPDIFDEITVPEKPKGDIFNQIESAKMKDIFDTIEVEKKPEPIKDSNFLSSYYRWLHEPQEPAKGIYDFLTRVIPKSTAATTVGLVEFPYFAVKAVTDPMYEFAKDMIIRDKPIEGAAKERGIELGKGMMDMAIGFGEFMGEPIGLYGWEKFKRKWLADPVGGAVAVAPMLKGGVGAAKGVKVPKAKMEFGIKAEGMIGMLQKAYDWMDVEAPFVRAGAKSTGTAIKRFAATKIVEQERAMQVAKRLKKFKLEEGEGLEVTLKASKKAKAPVEKPTAEFIGYQENVPGKPDLELYNVKGGRLDKSTVTRETLIEEGIDIPGELVKPRPLSHIDQAASEIRQYYKDTFKRLKQEKVLKHPWPESMKIRNQAEITRLIDELTNTPAKNKVKIDKLQEQINTIKDLNKNLDALDIEYVHIPLDQWFGKIYNTFGKEEAANIIHGGLSSSLYKGRFFKQRKTIDISKMIDWLRDLKDENGKTIFTDLDFDARMIMASYAQKVGTMRGLAKIFNAAKSDGLVIPIGQGLKTGYGSPPLEMTIRFPELKDHYIHNAFMDYLDGYLGRIDKGMQLGRIFGYTKMMAFYNPFFLPAYDLWQATWLGAVNPLRPMRTGKYLAKGFKSVFTKDKAYWESSEGGGFSTPYTPPFENFARDMRNTINGRFADVAMRKLKEYSKAYPIIDDFYRMVWNVAWSGDHAIRMASYHYLKDKGLGSLDAAQTTAYFHGDYARITPNARRILNKIFFTPSFKYSMGHLQANMVKSSVKVMRNALKLKKSQPRDIMLAKGGVMLIAGLLAKDQLMKLWGFKTDDIGLRYVKTTMTDEGEKELVLYWPDPNNVMLRQVHKWTKWGDDPDRMDAFMNKAHWDLHPLWQLSYELFKDIRPDGEHVYNPFDDKPKIAWDVMHHSVSRILAVEGFLERYTGTEGSKAAYKALRNDIGKVWEKFLSTTTLAYIRQPKVRRQLWQAKKLQRLFRQFNFEDQPKTPEQAQTRINNFFSRLKEIWEVDREKPKPKDVFDEINIKEVTEQ